MAGQAPGGIIKPESAHLQRNALAVLLTLEPLIKAWLQHKRMVKICSKGGETRTWGNVVITPVNKKMMLRLVAKEFSIALFHSR